MQKRGLTLMELTVAVIIIGILAAVALPMFGRAIEATKAKEALAALQQIRNGEKVFRVEKNIYWGPSRGSGAAEIAQINNNLRTFLDYRQNRNWDYSITDAAANTFEATATRRSGGLDYRGKTIVFDQDGLNASESTWPENLLPKE